MFVGLSVVLKRFGNATKKNKRRGKKCPQFHHKLIVIEFVVEASVAPGLALIFLFSIHSLSLSGDDGCAAIC